MIHPQDMKATRRWIPAAAAICGILAIPPIGAHGQSTTPSLVLSDGGLQFPDDSIQATSAVPTFFAPVGRTGQTTCWDEDGVVIDDCTGTGQDGEHQAGAAWPSPRFTDNLNGTVTDHLTGLIWMQDLNCTSGTWGGGSNNINNLHSGNTLACENYTGGITDWRLRWTRHRYWAPALTRAAEAADAPSSLTVLQGLIRCLFCC